MAKSRALINKLKRREKQVRTAADGFDTINKMDRAEETMAKSPKAYQLARKIQRRLDRNFGLNTIQTEQKLSRRDNIPTVDRFDYDPGAGTDFGIRITMAAGMIAAIGLRVNDLVFFKEGELKGKYLKVVALTDATHARLEDVATYVGPESAVIARFQLSDVKASHR